MSSVICTPAPVVHLNSSTRTKISASATRRRFLQRAGAAGVVAAALYVAPQVTSIRPALAQQQLTPRPTSTPTTPPCSPDAGLIVNGSFEDGTSPPVSGYRTLNNGDADITGWVIESGDIDWTGDFWQASVGQRSLDMNGGAPASVSQVIPTVAGVDYLVIFDMAGNPDCGEVSKTLDTVATDVESGSPVGSGSFSFNTTGKSKVAMGWTQKSFAFVAASASTKVKFTSTVEGFCGPTLDNVRVQECITPG